MKTQFVISGDKLDHTSIIDYLYCLIQDIDDAVVVSSNTWKLTFDGTSLTEDKEDEEDENIDIKTVD